MKKYIIVLCLLIIGLQGGACDYKCSEPYGLTSSVSRFFSTVSGQRALSEYVSKSIINKSILKNITDGSVKSELKSYSIKDLKAGKFKSVEIWGKNVNLQGIYISSIHAKTLCDFNYVSPKENGDVVIKEDLPFGFDVEFTEDDINNTMKSKNYAHIIDDINRLSLNVFQIDSTYSRIKNGKFHYVIKYYIPFIKGYKNMVFVSDLSAADGEIEFENTQILGDSAAINVKHFSRLINYLNPLDFSLQIRENKDAKINVKNVKITDNKVTADGILVVPKDKE